MSGFIRTATKLSLDKLLFGSVSFTPPTTYYAAALTVAPAADGTGYTEDSGDSYARVAITNNTTNFVDGTGAQVTNGTAITFPELDSGATDRDYVGIGFFDAATDGNCIAYAPAAKTVGGLDTYYVSASTLTITFSNDA